VCCGFITARVWQPHVRHRHRDTDQPWVVVTKGCPKSIGKMFISGSHGFSPVCVSKIRFERFFFFAQCDCLMHSYRCKFCLGFEFRKPDPRVRSNLISLTQTRRKTMGTRYARFPETFRTHFRRSSRLVPMWTPVEMVHRRGEELVQLENNTFLHHRSTTHCTAVSDVVLATTNLLDLLQGRPAQ